jgi:type IV pilus assembly protein PilV
MTTRRDNVRRAEGGFSLIEILISTIVFSIGVLGVTGLGALSKRATFEAVQRATAAELAYALLEEMRSNKAAIGMYLVAGTLGHGSLGAEPAPDCDVAGVDCSAIEFARHSLWVWELMLDTGMESSAGVGTGGLAEPSACITGPAGGVAGDYVVTVVWRGVTELTDSGLSACGAGTGLYGAGDNMRRMVIVRSFIDPNI